MIVSRRGMTLLEVLAAMVIAGLMLAAGTSTFTEILRHRRIIETASEATERAAALHEMLHGWLYSGTVSLPAGTPRGSASSNITTRVNGQISVNPAVVTGDVLTFTTTAQTPLNTATTTMRLFIDDDINTPEQGLTLEYRANVQSPLLRVQLDTTITWLSAEYRDTRTNRWIPSDQATGITPKAARVTFFSSDTLSGAVSGIISVPIVLPMGANPTAPNNNPQQGG